MNTTTSSPTTIDHQMSMSPMAMVHHNNPEKQMEHGAFLDLVKPEQATHVAVKNGRWFEPSTWQNGQVPGNGANVLIPEGIRVLYHQQSDARIRTVRVDGTLTFAANQDTKLVVDTFVNAPQGTLNIGTATSPIRADKTAQIIIADNGGINRQWDPTLLSRGLLSHGKVNIYGADKTDFVALNGDVAAGSDELVLPQVPENWRVGDRLVLGGTAFKYHGSHEDNSKFQDEVLTITAITGNRVRFTNNDVKTGDNTVLRFDHTRPDIPEKDQLKLYVANTTRNVTVESENGADIPISQRGHVMFMHNPDVRVNNAGFYELGRSDKTKVVDDPGQNVDGSRGQGLNPRGRYALHFHRTGAEDSNGPMAIATGNAVVGSPGWGIVHHDSHALLEDNVVFDVVGSGIVAESGNELGAWRNNLTIKTTGVGWDNINATRDRRDKRFDHGFRGEGYWVQGAAQVAMEDNIAISANDAGITIFGDTLHKEDPRDAETIAVKNLPKAIQSQVVVPGQEEVDITDVPLRQFTGFQSYNSTAGIRVWGHMTNFDGHLEFSSPNPTTAHDARSLIDDFQLWNNRLNGIQVEYSSNLDIQNGLIVGDVDKPARGDGIFHNHFTINTSYDNLTVRGFNEGIKFEFPNEDKSFLASRLTNSTFSDNTYNVSKIGQKMFKDRPDDGPAYLAIEDVDFEAKQGNAAPIASFGVHNAGGYGRWFDAKTSFDRDPLKPDGRALDPTLASRGIVAYGWDWDSDGTVDQFGRRVSHVFDRAGRHDVSLTVWDNQGATKTLTKTIDVQPKTYPNAFQDSDFSQITQFTEHWKTTSQWAEDTWFATPSVKLENGAARISKAGQWNGGIGQIIENDGTHRGRQTLRLDLQNLEGGQNQWQHNEIQIQLWGINGPFKSNLWDANGPESVGTLPMESQQLLDYSLAGDENGDKVNDAAFDWKTLRWDVDLGEGYQYLLFQVNTEGTTNQGDRVAIDNVRLTGKADAAAPASSTAVQPANPPLSDVPTPDMVTVEPADDVAIDSPPMQTEPVIDIDSPPMQTEPVIDIDSPFPPSDPILPSNPNTEANPAADDSPVLALSDLMPHGSTKWSRGVTTLSSDRTSLKIEGRARQASPINYTVTPDTMLSVEFRSDREGTFHSIGLDVDRLKNRGDRQRTFKLFGTRNWGQTDFDDYLTQSGWKTYEIPVGEYFTGDMSYLVFTHDQKRQATDVTSQFRNIRLFEASDGIANDTINDQNNALLPNPSSDPILTVADTLS